MAIKRPLLCVLGIGVTLAVACGGGRHRLGSSGYQRVTTSGIFPDLDLALLSQLAQEANQTGAVKKLRAWARDRG